MRSPIVSRHILLIEVITSGYRSGHVGIVYTGEDRNLLIRSNGSTAQRGTIVTCQI